VRNRRCCLDVASAVNSFVNTLVNTVRYLYVHILPITAAWSSAQVPRMLNIVLCSVRAELITQGSSPRMSFIHSSSQSLPSLPRSLHFSPPYCCSIRPPAIQQDWFHLHRSCHHEPVVPHAAQLTHQTPWSRSASEAAPRSHSRLPLCSLYTFGG